MKWIAHNIYSIVLPLHFETKILKHMITAKARYTSLPFLKSLCSGGRHPCWRHQIEAISTLLVTISGRSIPLTKASDAELWCFYQCLNKRLSKQSIRRWFETPSRSLWRHCNVIECVIRTSSSVEGLVAQSVMWLTVYEQGFNRPVTQILQCTSSISHNTPFVTEMCTCVHISATKWCIVRYLSDALWDL